MRATPKYLLLAALVMPLLAVPARADYLETFDELAVNAPYNSSNLPSSSASPLLPLVTSNNGLTVTYTDPATTPTTSPPPNNDPYGYVVRSNSETNAGTSDLRFDFVGLTGNMFIDFGNDPLKIALSSAASGIGFNFSLRFPSNSDDGAGDTSAIAPATSLILMAYLNGTLVGTGVYGSVVPDGHEFEEGYASFSGVSFNEIDIVSSNYNYLLYNGHGPSSAPVSVAIDNVEIPEPGSLALLGCALLLLVTLRRQIR